MATFTEDFTGMREEFDQAHRERQELYEHLKEDCEHLKEDCEQFKEQCAEQMKANREWFNGIRDQVRSELADFAGDLKAGAKVFRRGFTSR